jgi:uncharacterized protein YoxC
MGNGFLVQQYGITEETLAVRRQFIRLSEEDQQLLIQLIPWAEEMAPRIAKEFYDWQFAFAPTRTFFAEYAARKGMPLTVLRQHLERAQAGYFASIFSGARESWGVHYFENRLGVGYAHDQINLPFKWYIGSYVEYQRLTRYYLRMAFAEAPSRWSRKSSRPHLDINKAEEAIFKIFNYDMQAIGDSFLFSTLRSIGFNVTAIQTDRGKDRTEHMVQIKQMVSLLLQQAQAISESRLHDPVLEIQVSGKLGEAFAAMVRNLKEFTDYLMRTANALNTTAAACEEMNASIQEIVQNTNEASRVANVSAQEADKATATVAQLEGSSAEISGIVKVISSVAEQTNLLALNATIEAARAGEAGRGFAVVANEVKGLAKETAKSTEDINNRVTTIQGDAKAATKAIAQIVGAISRVNEVFNVIASSVEEQTATTAEITRHMTEAAQASAEIVQRFQQSSASEQSMTEPEYRGGEQDKQRKPKTDKDTGVVHLYANGHAREAHV